MELLRLEDMARLDKKRAAVIVDPEDKQKLRGYINLTYLLMDGVGTANIRSERGFDDLGILASYLNDFTQIQARVRKPPKPFFLYEELFDDPIHFFFIRPRLRSVESDRKVYLNEEEISLLGEYLRNGGFVFVDAYMDSYSQLFLREIVDYIRQALYPNGGLFEIPLGHPIYHSFYDFDSGFPGENKTGKRISMGASWHYPDTKLCRCRGLWGIQWGEELVGVVSDLYLSIYSWMISRPQGGIVGECGEIIYRDSSPEPYLRAMTNIVVYALTRPGGGLTTKLKRPAWEDTSKVKVLNR